MHNENLISGLSEFFKVLGDTTRLRILDLLLKKSMCVNEMSMKLNISQSAISHQLRVLKQAKLVKGRKDGKAVYYSLDDEHVREIYQIGKQHIEEI